MQYSENFDPQRGLFLAMLEAYAREIGHIPTFVEVDKAPNMPRANDFAFPFGSYEKAVQTLEKRLKPYIIDGTNELDFTKKQTEVLEESNPTENLPPAKEDH